MSEVCLTFAGSISRCIPAVVAGGTGGGGNSCVPGACHAVRRTRWNTTVHLPGAMSWKQSSGKLK